MISGRYLHYNGQIETMKFYKFCQESRQKSFQSVREEFLSTFRATADRLAYKRMGNDGHFSETVFLALFG